MLPCEHVRGQLPEFIADGEPSQAIYRDMITHLSGCAACREHTEILRVVERALRIYPVVAPSSLLRARIIEATPEREEWEPLPWSVWVPGLAFFLALLVALLSLPPRLLPVEELPLFALGWHTALDVWLSSIPLGMSRDLFWALWIGLFATTAGIGLSLSLVRWNTLNTESLDELEAHVSDAAQQLWNQARRAN